MAHKSQNHTDATAYQDLQHKHQEEVNAFLKENAFFAFSDAQFSKGLAKFGIKPEESASKLVALYGGGFVLKDKKDALDKIFKRQKAEFKDFQRDDNRLITAIVKELENHEFGITGDVTDTLLALDLYDDYLADERIQKAVAEAIKIHNAAYIW